MATQTRVVLKQNIPTLGKSGDVVRVRPGYARNFLLPRGLAVFATEINIARIDELKKQASAKADAEQSAAAELKQKLEATSVKFERAVGEEGKMYGSVTARDIEDAFRAQGLVFDRRKLSLAEPIRTLGVSEVALKVHGDVVATLRVEVVKKGA